MRTFIFDNENLKDALATLNTVKAAKKYDFIALKPSTATVTDPETMEKKKYQVMKFSLSNETMQVDSYAECVCKEDGNAVLVKDSTILLPRRFLDTCKCIQEASVQIKTTEAETTEAKTTEAETTEENKCIQGATVQIEIDETCVSLIDKDNNRIPFPILSPESNILLIPDVSEVKDPKQHILQRTPDFSLQMNTENFVEALLRFGGITSNQETSAYTHEGVGCIIDEKLSALFLTSSNGHLFRKGSFTYGKYVHEEGSTSEFIIPYEMISFLKAADIYENSVTTVRMTKGVLYANVLNATAYFRLKEKKYAPAKGFDSFLAVPTIASCKVSADDFVNKLKLLEVSASSSELIGNSLGVEIQISEKKICIKNPNSPKTLLSIKAEKISGEGTVYLNGTELIKLLPKESIYTLELCGEKNTHLKINGYHVMLPLSREKKETETD